ncbi:MAG: hypothetical protein IJR44_01615, partial [Neisseriaceae bacterium]|nr:hypothetical protein [Neisseriaceae bacterium]
MWDEWLQEAQKNPTVKAITDSTQRIYANKGHSLDDIQATEEAMVEIFAAYKTGQWEFLSERHQVEISNEFKKPQGTVARLWNSAKEKIGKIFNRQPESLPDSAVFAMLGKLDQSLYQFPERMQYLGNLNMRFDLFGNNGDLFGLPDEQKQAVIEQAQKAIQSGANAELAQQLAKIQQGEYEKQGIAHAGDISQTDTTGNLNEKDTVIVREQSERGNPLLKSETELNDKLLVKIKAAYPDETNRSIRQKLDIWTDENYGFLENGFEKTKELFPKAFTTPLSKEQKAELKAAKDAMNAAKKTLKEQRDEYYGKVGYISFNETESRYRIIHAQRRLHEAERTYNRLYLDLHSQTGEMTDIEKQIFNARLSGKLSERVAIVLPELKAQKDELRQEYDALSDRIKRLDFDEFEIQGAMQDAIEHFNKRHYRILRHNGEDLPHSTDREKAIAYLAKVVMPEQLDQIATPHNNLLRKIRQLSRRETYTPDEMADKYQVRFLSVLETAENQLIKGSIEARAEINLTYDINTPDGEQKVRELFYKNPHDSEQAELFEKVFAMAQKLNVEVRHALTDKYVNIDTRNYLGVYLYTQNSARVKHNGRIQPEQKGEVLLHELVHAVSSRAMVLKEQGHTELLNPAQIQAIDEIEKIFKSVWNKAEALGLEKYSHQKGDYGLKNAHEMLAELANPVFRDKLKQIGVFDDTVAKITEISTGVGQAETVYDRLTKALYQLMDNYDPDFGE